jgi:hypothetical protein
MKTHLENRSCLWPERSTTHSRYFRGGGVSASFAAGEEDAGLRALAFGLLVALRRDF